MPPKKNDPFNFDDFYKAAGADGFIKKPLAELKKEKGSGGGTVGTTAPGTQQTQASAPVPTQTRHPAPTIPLSSDALSFLGKELSNASDFAEARPLAEESVKSQAFLARVRDLLLLSEDMSGPAKKAPPPAPAPVQKTSATHDPFASLSSAGPGARPAVTSTSGGDDPFAMFDDVPGLSATISAAPPVAQAAAAPAAQGMHSVGSFPGFEDIPAFPAEQPPVRQSSQHVSSTLAPASHSNDFGGWSDFSDATHQPQAPPQQTRPQPQEPPPRQPAPTRAQPPPQPAYASAGYEQHAERPGPARPAHVPFSEHVSGSGRQHHEDRRSNHSNSSHDQGDLGRRFSDGAPDRHSGGKPGEASAGSGVMGMLRGFGKKAVRAAQIGLQHIESALDKVDQGPLSQQQQKEQRQQQQRVGGEREYGSGRMGGPREYEHYNEPSHGYQMAHGQHVGGGEDDPASLALTILALPPDERAGALASLPPSLRQEVDRMVAELMSGDSASPPPPPPAHTRTTPAHVVPPRHVSSQQALAIDIRTSPVDLSAWEPPHKSNSDTNLTHAASRTRPTPAPAAPAAAAPAWEAAFGASPRAGAQQQHVASAQVVHTQEEDLMGLGTGHVSASAPARPAAPPAAPAPAHVPTDDLLGVHAAAPPAAPPNIQAQVPAPRAAVADVDDMHDFFSAGAPAAPQAAAAPAAAASSRPVPAPKAAASQPMVDLVGTWEQVNVDVSAHKHLYEDNEGDENEPEIRKRLRAARLAEKHAKMQSALASKLAADEAEAKQREEQVALKEQHKALVEAWKNKSKGNVRGLLGSLQTVLWEDSGWQPIGMADLLEPGQIRKAWMKANLLVHPDKVRQRNGTPDQVARADMIFDVLKDAWNTFQTTK